MPKTDEVIAVLCSDIHLSHLPPLIRAAEPNWYRAMVRPLVQVENIAKAYGCPIVCAGDVFDRWNSPPELINFAINCLPQMYAVPGQHDLPNHNYEEIHRCAYETLVRAGKITDLSPEDSIWTGRCHLVGVPWGHEITKPEDGLRDRIIVAVVHAYCWRDKDGYPGAPRDGYVTRWAKRLKGYTAAAVGDNHRGFHCGKILNCGTLMRRKSDELHYKPAVGLLRSDGTMRQHFLDISDDKFIEQTDEIAELKETQGLDLTLFVDELRELAPGSLDFREAVNRVCADKGVSAPIRKIILGTLDAAGRI